jgi:hypothetical protein
MLHVHACTDLSSLNPLQGGEMDTIPVMVKSLTELVNYSDLDHIDLLDVDTEGTELEVLQSYDWHIKPKCVLVEYNNSAICFTAIAEFMRSKGYIMHMTFNNINALFIQESNNV